MYLFDASSIVNLVKRGILRVLGQGLTIDLARYEALNAVWKEYLLLKQIDRETMLEFTDILSKIFDIIRIENIQGNEREVIELAAREKLTIYDASYLLLAIKKNLILVTDDEKLKKKASKYVKVRKTQEIINQETR